MWRQYFGAHALVYGLDISPRTKVYERHPAYGTPNHIFVGSQGDAAVWETVRREVPGGMLDIIIDDGAHSSGLQIQTHVAA
eukprot:4568780-Prymnesium_polylepis.1